MMTGFSRLFLIGMGVIMALALFWMGLRRLGGTREFEVFDHPLLKAHQVSPWIIAKGGDHENSQAYTEKAIREALKWDESLGLELPLHRSIDGVWFVFPANRLEEMTNGEGPPETFTWAQLVSLNAGFHSLSKKKPTEIFRQERWHLISLRQVVELAPQRLLVLTFFDPTASFVAEVATLINSLDIEDRVIIRSPFTKFVRELRKIEPMWVYGSDSPSISRAMILDHLKIETLISFNEDVVIANKYLNGSLVFTPSFISEIQRQKKRMILDVDDEIDSHPVSLEEMKAFNGILTNDWRWVRQQFRPTAAP